MGGIILSLEFILYGIAPVLLLGPRVTGSAMWCFGLLAVFGLIMVTVVLIPYIKRWDVERDNYADGRKGEERLVRLLQNHLDSEMAFCQNQITIFKIQKTKKPYLKIYVLSCWS